MVHVHRSRICISTAFEHTSIAVTSTQAHPVRHVEVVRSVEGEAPRSAEASGCGGAAVATVASEATDVEVAAARVRRDHARPAVDDTHSVVAPVCDEQVARTVYRKAARLVQCRVNGKPALAVEIGSTISRDNADDRGHGRHHDDSVIISIADVEVARCIVGETPRRCKFGLTSCDAAADRVPATTSDRGDVACAAGDHADAAVALQGVDEPCTRGCKW